MSFLAEREQLATRLGFILVSAGCAVGLGNVWRFPYITGRYGGAIFVLFYVIFLMVMGLPIMVCEYSMGRASRRNLAGAMLLSIFQGGLRPGLFPLLMIFAVWDII